jgi:hypothetical protein
MRINKYNDIKIKFGDNSNENEDKRINKADTDTSSKNDSFIGAIIY